MANREQKIEEFMESIQSMRHRMAFRFADSGKMPRVTPSQWGALMLIEQRGESTVKDIAKALSITSSAATQLVDGLAVSGYVVRKTQTDDRRAVTLTLSNKTKNQVGKMKKEAMQKFLKFFEVLNDREFNQYFALNNKIIQNYNK
jgi:DNA-binding MarR family transcriptional regulator